MREKVLNWMTTGRVGLSSKAMAAHLCGAPCDGSYPHDPDDLNRCLLFLEAVPEARAELPRMATVNKTWAALVARWGEIEAAFLAEVGRDWQKAKRAPRTYRLMREVIDAANSAISLNPTAGPEVQP
jgi:hypothetical protein